MDPAGNVYVADSWNHTIRRITPTGFVTTLAGQVGLPGTNDGPVHAARFRYPRGVALDSATNLYVADSGNSTIRKISPNGLDKMEAERRIRSPVADAIRLIALTGCRRSEAAGLCWKHVDLKQGRIVLPPQSHKTGRKTGKPREIILPAEAQKIIVRQGEGGPDDFVFAPARGDGAVALSKAWRKVRKEAELPPTLGLHGLRHSIASHLAMSGAQAAEIMTAMGHRQMSTVQRYIHFANTAREALAERAASVALSGMKAGREAKGGE